MSRPADIPGKFRVKSRSDGDWLLSGITLAGKRIRQRHGSEIEALRAGATLFRREEPGAVPPAVATPTTQPSAPPTTSPLDDWGLPRVDELRAANVNKIFGLPGPGAQPAAPPVDEVAKARKAAEEKAAAEVANKLKAKNVERYRELCDLLGIGYVMGVRVGSEWLTRRVGKEPVKTSKGHVTKLQEYTRDTLVDLIGERQLKPWQMMVLLTVAMPVSMMIQSPRIDRPQPLSTAAPGSATAQPASPGLKSV